MLEREDTRDRRLRNLVPAAVNAHSVCQGHRILKGIPTSSLRYTLSPCSRGVMRLHSAHGSGSEAGFNWQCHARRDAGEAQESPRARGSPSLCMVSLHQMCVKTLSSRFCSMISCNSLLASLLFYHVSPLGIRYKAFVGGKNKSARFRLSPLSPTKVRQIVTDMY